MSPFRLLVCTGLILLSFGMRSGDAALFRWASDGDVNSMDPYSRSETFLLTFLQNIYDPLVRRDPGLKIEPALAISWEQPSPNIWRFHLRPHVRFQDGTPFTADDVVFSYRRASGTTSQLRPWFANVAAVRKIDPLTVDFETVVPDPVFVDGITFWVIMSKSWCEAHGATEPADLARSEENYASRHANGTGPFILASREPDRRTTLVNNPNWWDTPQHNLTQVEFDVIGNASTRVAALLSGDVAMIYSVPPQYMQRIAETPDVRLIRGPELRTIFLGFDQSRDVLLHSDVRDRNPFKDRRVRQAFYEAIDIQAIHERIMRGQSHPTGLLYGPGINGYTAKSDVRWPYDPAHARELLAEAGYKDGFGVTLDCPDDRYVDDEAICRSLAPMLARIGVRLTLNIQPRMRFFARISGPRYETSFFMLGWLPNTYDAFSALYNLAGTRDGTRGVFNIGGYSNPDFDTLLERMFVEQNPAVRQADIIAASKLLHDESAFVPLHQQEIVWAARDNIELKQMADNSFPLRLVRVKP